MRKRKLKGVWCLEPVSYTHLVNDPDEIDSFVEKMRRVDVLDQGLIPKYLEWREKIKARYGIDLKYGDGIKGCATMMGQICGITNFLTWIITDPEEMRKLIGCWLETSKRYLKKMREVTGFPKDRHGFSFASCLLYTSIGSICRFFAFGTIQWIA